METSTRREILLKTPVDRIRAVCASDPIYKQICASREFWLEKLSLEQLLPARDQTTDEGWINEYISLFTTQELLNSLRKGETLIIRTNEPLTIRYQDILINDIPEKYRIIDETHSTYDNTYYLTATIDKNQPFGYLFTIRTVGLHKSSGGRSAMGNFRGYFSESSVDLDEPTISEIIKTAVYIGAYIYHSVPTHTTRRVVYRSTAVPSGLPSSIRSSRVLPEETVSEVVTVTENLPPNLIPSPTPSSRPFNAPLSSRVSRTSRVESLPY